MRCRSLASYCKGYLPLAITMVPSNELGPLNVTKLSKTFSVKLPVAPANRPVPPVMECTFTIKTTSGFLVG